MKLRCKEKQISFNVRYTCYHELCSTDSWKDTSNITSKHDMSATHLYAILTSKILEVLYEEKHEDTK